MKKLLALLISIIMCFSSVVCFAEEIVFSDEAPDMSAEISNILGKEDNFYVIDTNTTITFNATLEGISIYADEWAAETVYDSSYLTDTDKCTYTYEPDTYRRMVYTKDGREYEEDTECIKKGSVLKFNEPGTYYMFISRITSVDDIAEGRYSASGNLRFIVEQGEWLPEEITEETYEDKESFEWIDEPVEEDGWTIEDEVAMHLDPKTITLSKVVNFVYNYDEIISSVAICNSEAVITIVDDVDNLVVSKMKKTADGWVPDYVIEEENPYIDVWGWSPKNAGYTLKIEEPGIYDIWCEFDGSYCSMTFAVVKENAKYTDSRVMVDGKEVQFEAYNINDNNYFKLRDIAKVLSGTKKQFDVLWNDDLQCIMLTSNTPYTEVGGELTPGDGKSKVAVWGTGDISKDHTQIDIKAYMINDNNYFKLRDLGELFDFDVSWDGENNCVLIDSESSYTED